MEKWSLLLDGLQLLVFGMGMVLAFLVIMIVLMNLLAKVLQPFAAKFDALKAPATPARPLLLPMQPLPQQTIKFPTLNIKLKEKANDLDF